MNAATVSSRGLSNPIRPTPPRIPAPTYLAPNISDTLQGRDPPLISETPWALPEDLFGNTPIPLDGRWADLAGDSLTGFPGLGYDLDAGTGGMVDDSFARFLEQSSGEEGSGAFSWMM